VDIFNNITNAFEKKYSWIGKDFSEEFLMSACSFPLQVWSKPEFRIRRHLLLFWSHAWFKSSLLLKAKQLLGEKLCTGVSDISNAALRGTVEGGQFLTPLVLKRPFTVCTEFGQVTCGNDGDLIQKLLNVLEEGQLDVSLAKIAFLTNDQKATATREHGITFIDNNTFSYQTDWILLAGTYNKKFMVDNAFESRFVIMTPQQELDGKLLKHVVNSPSFFVDEETKNAFRNELFSPLAIDTKIVLPEEIYDLKGITPRDCASLLSYILCRAWWNLETTDKQVIAMASEYSKNREDLWASAEDRIYDILENSVPLTVTEVWEKMNPKVCKRQVYYSLKKIAVPLMNSGGERKYRL